MPRPKHPYRQIAKELVEQGFSADSGFDVICNAVSELGYPSIPRLTVAQYILMKLPSGQPHEEATLIETDEEPTLHSDDEDAEMATIHTNGGLVPKRKTGWVDLKTDVGDLDDVLDSHYATRDPLILVGEAGTGKTTGVEQWCARRGKPFLRIPGQGAALPETFVGQWTQSEDGTWQWVDGLMTRAIRKGGVVLVDEVNAIPPSIAFVLHSVLDSRKLVLTEHEHEVITAHSDFWVVGAMNPDYDGTNQLNLAFADRFRTIVELKYDNRVDMAVIGQEGVSGKNRDLIVKLANRLRDGYPEKVSIPCSYRQVRAIAFWFKQDGWKVAMNAFCGRLMPEERQAVKELWRVVTGQ